MADKSVRRRPRRSDPWYDVPMALWIEKRDSDGQTITKGQFINGFAHVVVCEADFDMNVEEARQLIRVSPGVWTFRISFED